jgi:DNA-binding MarR family transcriptional regulator
MHSFFFNNKRAHHRELAYLRIVLGPFWDKENPITPARFDFLFCIYQYDGDECFMAAVRHGLGCTKQNVSRFAQVCRRIGWITAERRDHLGVRLKLTPQGEKLIERILGIADRIEDVVERCVDVVQNSARECLEKVRERARRRVADPHAGDSEEVHDAANTSNTPIAAVKDMPKAVKRDWLTESARQYEQWLKEISEDFEQPATPATPEGEGRSSEETNERKSIDRERLRPHSDDQARFRESTNEVDSVATTEEAEETIDETNNERERSEESSRAEELREWRAIVRSRRARIKKRLVAPAQNDPIIAQDALRKIRSAFGDTDLIDVYRADFTARVERLVFDGWKRGKLYVD